MTIAYTIRPDVSSKNRKLIHYTGATVGSTGNSVITGLSTIESISNIDVGTGTVAVAPTVTVSGGTITIYASAAEGYLTVEGY